MGLEFCAVYTSTFGDNFDTLQLPLLPLYNYHLTTLHLPLSIGIRLTLYNLVCNLLAPRGAAKVELVEVEVEPWAICGAARGGEVSEGKSIWNTMHCSKQSTAF